MSKHIDGICTFLIVLSMINVLAASQGCCSRFGGGGLSTSTGRIRAIVTPGQEGSISRELTAKANRFVSANRFLEQIISESGLYAEHRSREGFVESELLDRFRSNLSYSITPNSGEMTFQFQHAEPEVARNICDRILESFIQSDTHAPDGMMKVRLDGVQKQISEVESELAKQQELIRQLETGSPPDGDGASPASVSKLRQAEARAKSLQERRRDLDTQRTALQFQRDQSGSGPRYIIIDPCNLPTAR